MESGLKSLSNHIFRLSRIVRQRQASRLLLKGRAMTKEKLRSLIVLQGEWRHEGEGMNRERAAKREELWCEFEAWEPEQLQSDRDEARN